MIVQISIAGIEPYFGPALRKSAENLIRLDCQAGTLQGVECFRRCYLTEHRKVRRREGCGPSRFETIPRFRGRWVIEARSQAEWANREGLSEYAVRWNWVDEPSGSGFTAVLRVKDEARSLPWVLPGVLRSVEKTIVVDNGSTDGTPDVAREVAEGLGLGERLEVLSYPFAVSRCGPEHLWTYPDSVHSLTYFYNWSFSHVGTRYALKWDGDMVLTPEGEGVLGDLAWQLQGIDAAITMRRDPVYVGNERVAYIDFGQTPFEPWGWRNTPEHTFIKCL